MKASRLLPVLSALAADACTPTDETGPTSAHQAVVTAAAGPRAKAVGGEFTIAAGVGVEEISYSVATDGTDYLVVFQRDGAVKARVVHPDGTRNAPVQLAQSGGVPMAAFDGTNYLVAWMDPVSQYVKGQFVDPAGARVGIRFNLTTGSASALAGLAYANGQYCLTFRRPDTQLYRRLMTPGKVFSATTLAVSAALGAVSHAYHSDLATDGTNFLVAYPTGPGKTIAARIIRSDGTLGSEHTVDNSAQPSSFDVTVGYMGGEYLVVWSDLNQLGDFHTYARRLNQSGQAVGASIKAGGPNGWLAMGVLPVEGTWLVLYQQQSPNSLMVRIRGRYFSSAGISLGQPVALFPVNGATSPILGAAIPTSSGAFFVVDRATPTGGSLPGQYDTYTGHNVFGAFTDLTAPGPYDGDWAGTTSQGKAISFTVTSFRLIPGFPLLTGFSKIFIAGDLIGACGSVTVSMPVFYDFPKPIVNGTFDFTQQATQPPNAKSFRLAGSLNTTTTASGTAVLQDVLTPPFAPCTYSGSVTWTADKQ